MTIPGADPLGYTIIQQPSIQRISSSRNPNGLDKAYKIGTEWVNSTDNNMFKLTGFKDGSAVWEPLAGGGAATNLEVTSGENQVIIKPDPRNSTITLRGDENITVEPTANTEHSIDVGLSSNAPGSGIRSIITDEGEDSPIDADSEGRGLDIGLGGRWPHYNGTYYGCRR